MTKLIINVETGETFERELTEEELVQQTKDEVKAEKVKAEAKAKGEARAALLERLGITEEEAKLLLG